MKGSFNELPSIENRSIRVVYRHNNKFQNGYQPRTNLVNDDKDDLPADSHSILTGWKNRWCQLSNVRGVNDVRQQTAVYTAEPPVSEPAGCELGMASEIRKSYKPLASDWIRSPLIQWGAETVQTAIHRLSDSERNREERCWRREASVVVAYLKK